MLLLPLLIIAHLLGDFIVQTDEVAKGKHYCLVLNRHNKSFVVSPALKRHIKHHAWLSAIAALCVIIPDHHSLFLKILWFLAILAVSSVSHLVIDIVKITVDHVRQGCLHAVLQMNRIPVRDAATRKNTIFTSLLVFFGDQILHVIVLIILARLYAPNVYFAVPMSFFQFVTGTPVALTTIGRLLWITITAICATYTSGIIVQMVCKPAPTLKRARLDGKITTTETYNIHSQGIPQREVKYEESYAPEETTTVQRGKQIGYIERLITMIVVAVGAYTAIAFIVTAKSIVRFKKLDHQEFAEYFLVGTLTSIFLGTLAGLIVKQLLSP